MPSDKHSIFRREPLRPSQLRTVADRRFDDAEYLKKSRLNARANGAMYLGGFVVECLLKALLLEKYGWLRSVRSPESLGKQAKARWYLCYKWHDLEGLLAHLPEVTNRLLTEQQMGRPLLVHQLRQICDHWTVFARYSPRSATIEEAATFLNQVKELKRWLR